jgi:acyl-[acyl-carrier-protein] desaturase
MLANWGYEECKHSMVLEDWLLKARMRSDEQVADMHQEVFAHEWDLPYDNARAMIIYTTFQEVATRIHYTRLAQIVRREGGCPALERALQLVATDEAAHGDFFRRLVSIYLDYDRPGTLEQLRRVVNTFRMPSAHMLSDGMQRINEVKSFDIFTDEIFFFQVYEPVMTRLGVHRSEMRRKQPREQLVPLAGPNVKP